MSKWIYKLLRRHLSDEDIATFTEKQLQQYIADTIIEKHFGYYPYEIDYSPGSEIVYAMTEIHEFIEQRDCTPSE